MVAPTHAVLSVTLDRHLIWQLGSRQALSLGATRVDAAGAQGTEHTAQGGAAQGASPIVCEQTLRNGLTSTWCYAVYGSIKLA